ncbi:hypothetical protein Tco_1372590 [Tanacetum coccineum]
MISTAPLPTELKEIPSMFAKLTDEVQNLKNYIHKLEIKLPSELKEIPSKMEDFTKTITSLTSQVAKLKTLQWELPVAFLPLPTHVTQVQAQLNTLDAIPSLFVKVTDALNRFVEALENTTIAGIHSVPSASQASTKPAKGEKNTNQTTISQLFQRAAKRTNLNKPQPEATTTPPPIPPIITTDASMQAPFFPSPPRSSSQAEREHTKKDKGKKVMSPKDVEEESSESGSDNDNEIRHMPSSVTESSKQQKLKKFDFIIIDGKHIHLSKEDVSLQRKLEEAA